MSIAISRNNNINFKASFIKTLEVEKYYHKAYIPHKVNLFSLDIYQRKDLTLLEKMKNIVGGVYAQNIFNYAQAILQGKKNFANFLFITTQKNKFEKLDPKRTLGLMVYTEDKNFNFLDFIQISSKAKYNVDIKRPFKKVGTAFLDYLKEKSGQKPIKLNSDCEAIDFYYLNGFENDYDNKRPYMFPMIWQAD